MRVFIVCNAYLKTGGVEAVHQLVEQLTMRNIDTYIFYLEKEYSMNESVPEIYKKYGAKVVSEFIDAEDSVLIVPESFLGIRNWCTKGQVAIWWLSVDNASRMDYQELLNENIIHFVQSFYAKKYLADTLGIESYYLSDYISSSITECGDEHRETSVRNNVCFYNPKKGYEYVKELIARTNNRFEWVPITGMDPEQVARLLCTGKVYIDFGNHPGKDRIPREAAYCGCCILTNKKGSAEFFEDVAIPEKYKFDEDDNYEKVIDQIEYMIQNYDSVKEEFYPYIEKISREKSVFGDEVEAAIKILQENIRETSEKAIDVNAVTEYLQMMNQQLDNLKNINVKLEEFVKAGFSKQSVDILLREDNLYKDLLAEVWELLRYLA